MNTLKSKLIYLLVLIGSFTQAANLILYNGSDRMWGYFLQITDTNYIPKVINTGNLGYIMLKTGITDYDAVFAKYKITDFYQYTPTAGSVFLRQIYALVCDSGQTQLGSELAGKFSTSIPYIEIFNLKADITTAAEIKMQDVIYQKGNVLFFGNTDRSAKAIRFYNLRGDLLFSTNTFDYSIDPSGYLRSKGIYIYEIEIGNERITGKYFKLI